MYDYAIHLLVFLGQAIILLVGVTWAILGADNLIATLSQFRFRTSTANYYAAPTWFTVKLLVKMLALVVVIAAGITMVAASLYGIATFRGVL